MATTYLLTDLPGRSLSSRRYFSNAHTSICGPLLCRENSFDFLGTYPLDLSPPHQGCLRVSQSCLSDPKSTSLNSKLAHETGSRLVVSVIYLLLFHSPRVLSPPRCGMSRTRSTRSSFLLDGSLLHSPLLTMPTSSGSRGRYLYA